MSSLHNGRHRRSSWGRGMSGNRYIEHPREIVVGRMDNRFCNRGNGTPDLGLIVLWVKQE